MTRTRLAFAGVIAWGFIVTLGTSAGLAAPGNTYVGLNGGVALPSSSSSVFSWGADLGHSLSPAWSVGAYLSRYGIGLDAGTGTAVTATVSSSTTFYGVMGRYSFAGSLQNVYATLRMGLGKSSSSISTTNATTVIATNDSTSGFTVGPGIGYDHPVGSFTLGGEARYILGLSSTAPSALFVLFSGKFWF